MQATIFPIRSTRFSIILIILLTSKVSSIESAPSSSPKVADESDEVIFEKVLDEPNEEWPEPRESKVIIEPPEQIDQPPVCTETQNGNGGGQCIDLLAALHSLLMDDFVPVATDGRSARRFRRSVEGHGDGTDRPSDRNSTENSSESVEATSRPPPTELGGTLTSAQTLVRRGSDGIASFPHSNFTGGSNGTNSTSLDEFADFPLPDEEPVFALGSLTTDPISLTADPSSASSTTDSTASSVFIDDHTPESVSTQSPPDSLTSPASPDSSGSTSEYGIAHEEMINSTVLPDPSPSSENSSFVDAFIPDETLLWEIATAIAQMGSDGGNTSVVDDESERSANRGGDHGAMERIETLLTKLLPILVHMKESIRRNGDERPREEVASGSSPTDHDLSSTLPSAPPSVQRQFLMSVNATGPLTIGSPSPSEASESYNFSIPIVEPAILEPSSPPPSPSTDRPAASSTPSPDRPTSPEVSGYQLWSKEKSHGHFIESKTLQNMTLLREKLQERAPHFLPKEQAAWWNVEKRRQQACILLSSFDLVRQKCCFTLPLICPEYASIILQESQRQQQRSLVIDGDGTAAVVFERTDAGRGRRDGTSDGRKNALIADTLARISGLLSVLIRDGKK